MRKFPSSHRVSMTTEYQDRFLPPFCHRTLVSTTTQKNRYHPLRGTSNDISVYRSIHVTHARIKHPPKPPQQPKLPQPKALPPPMQLKVHPTRSSTADASVQNRLASTSEDYTSVYKKDFRAWNTKKWMTDSKKFQRGQGIANVPDPDQIDVKCGQAAQRNERPQFERVTSYRSDYVAHPLPPRTTRKPADQTNTDLPVDPALGSIKRNQEASDGADGLLMQFHNCSLNTKFHSQSKDRVAAEAANVSFLSTTHAHYTAHRCQRTRPILPPMNTTGPGREPFQGLTTMREDYRAWETPRHNPVPAKEKEQKEQHLSASEPTPAQSCEPNSGPTELPSEMNKAAACNAADEAPHPARNQTFSKFHHISPGKEGSRT